jgi:hypothetical protein
MKGGLTKSKVWLTRSSSGPAIYETVLWSDATLSCNCPGWTRRVAKDGSRSCKHLTAALAEIKDGITLRIPVNQAMEARMREEFADKLAAKITKDALTLKPSTAKGRAAAKKAWATRKSIPKVKGIQTISYQPTTEPPENRRRVFFDED